MRLCNIVLCERAREKSPRGRRKKSGERGATRRRKTNARTHKEAAAPKLVFLLYVIFIRFFLYVHACVCVYFLFLFVVLKKKKKKSNTTTRTGIIIIYTSFASHTVLYTCIFFLNIFYILTHCIEFENNPRHDVKLVNEK